MAIQFNNDNEADNPAWSKADWFAEAERRFGPDKTRWSFICPGCSTISTGQDFADVEANPERASYQCIGHAVKGRGCRRTASGRRRGPVFIELPHRRSRTAVAFRFAPALRIVK